MKNIALAERTAAFDVNAVRRQFPILARMVPNRSTNETKKYLIPFCFAYSPSGNSTRLSSA